MPTPTPVLDDDIFSTQSVCNARAVDDALREMAPVVKLARENITMLARYQHVSESLKDWQAFSSRSRPWHDPNSVRPEILLVDDPPRHTAVRPVIASALSPKALAKMATDFNADADTLLREVKELSGEVVDVVTAISRPFVYKVLPDLLGLPREGRENLTAFGHMELAGGCDCRHIRYRLETHPLFVHCCHCRWCQRETGTAFALNAMIEADRVTLLGAQPEGIDTPSASGKGQKIFRCPKCRIAVWSNYAGAGPLIRFIRVGTLDDPDQLPPDIHIFSASKQP